jgi:hypothetical protein
MASLLFFPAGSAVAGPLADATSPSLALMAFALASGLALVVTLAVPTVRALAATEPIRHEPPGEGVARAA